MRSPFRFKRVGRALAPSQHGAQGPISVRSSRRRDADEPPAVADKPLEPTAATIQPQSKIQEHPTVVTDTKKIKNSARSRPLPPSPHGRPLTQIQIQILRVLLATLSIPLQTQKTKTQPQSRPGDRNVPCPRHVYKEFSSLLAWPMRSTTMSERWATSCFIEVIGMTEGQPVIMRNG